MVKKYVRSKSFFQPHFINIFNRRRFVAAKTALVFFQKHISHISLVLQHKNWRNCNSIYDGYSVELWQSSLSTFVHFFWYLIFYKQTMRILAFCGICKFLIVLVAIKNTFYTGYRLPFKWSPRSFIKSRYINLSLF